MTADSISTNCYCRKYNRVERLEREGTCCVCGKHRAALSNAFGCVDTAVDCSNKHALWPHGGKGKKRKKCVYVIFVCL